MNTDAPVRVTDLAIDQFVKYYTYKFGPPDRPVEHVPTPLERAMIKDAITQLTHLKD